MVGALAVVAGAVFAGTVADTEIAGIAIAEETTEALAGTDSVTAGALTIEASGATVPESAGLTPSNLPQLTTNINSAVQIIVFILFSVLIIVIFRNDFNISYL